MSAIPVEKGTDPHELAEKLAEYGFLRLKDKKIRPFIYIGDQAGEDSDGYASIKNPILVGSVSDSLIEKLDAGLHKKMVLEHKIKKSEKRLKNWTGDAIGRDIEEEFLKKQKEDYKIIVERYNSVIHE